MGEDTYGVFHRERSTLIYSKSVDDSVDEYLDDPNLSIVDMIQIVIQKKTCLCVAYLWQLFSCFYFSTMFQQ